MNPGDKALSINNRTLRALYVHAKSWPRVHHGTLFKLFGRITPGTWWLTGDLLHLGVIVPTINPKVVGVQYTDEKRSSMMTRKVFLKNHFHVKQPS